MASFSQNLIVFLTLVLSCISFVFLLPKINLRTYLLTYILPNISRNKGNQTMKFGQLIEYSIFLKNHTQNVVEKLFPDPSPKNQN